MSEPAIDALDGLRAEVAGLRDLFLRRLMEDKGRQRLYDALLERSRAAQDLAEHRAFDALFRETLLAVDRLVDEDVTPELAASVAAELLEVLARRGVEAVPAGPAFDPRVHEVVGTRAADADAPAGTVAAVRRAGYRVGDRLLRPAQVTLAVVPAPGPAPEPAEAGGA